MILNQQRFAQVERVLNYTLHLLEGKPFSFVIHYWGAVPQHYDNPVHRHSFFEVCYVVEGIGEYTDGTQEFKLEPGTLFCSRPGIWHQIRSKAGMALLYVAFELHGEDDNISLQRSYEHRLSLGNVVVKEAGESPCIFAWKALVNLAAQSHLASDTTLKALGYSLLCSFEEAFVNSRQSHESPQLKEQSALRESSKLVFIAKRYIRDNLSKPLTIDEVALHLYVSSRHVSRLLKLSGETSFIRYLRQERLREAVKLLKTTNESLKQIAELTGFESVHYFTRVFTSAMGQPPGKYRAEKFRSNP